MQKEKCQGSQDTIVPNPMNLAEKKKKPGSLSVFFPEVSEKVWVLLAVSLPFYFECSCQQTI